MEKLLIDQYKFFFPVTNIARCSRRAELCFSKFSLPVIDYTSQNVTLQIWGVYAEARAFCFDFLALKFLTCHLHASLF